MAILADVEAAGGIPVVGAYVRIVDPHVIEAYTEVLSEAEGEPAVRSKAYILGYRVLVYRDEKVRAAEGARVITPNLDAFKCDYDPEKGGNPFAVAYMDLKARVANSTDA